MAEPDTPMNEKTCWFSFEDGAHTCMLPDRHDGPHQATSDDDILVSLATPGDTRSNIILTVLGPQDDA